MKKILLVLFGVLFCVNANALDLNKAVDNISSTAQSIETKKVETKAKIEAKKAEEKAKIENKKKEIKAKIEAKRENLKETKKNNEDKVKEANDNFNNLKNTFSK